MSLKHKMIHSVIVTIKNNKDGSYRTQADRRRSLINMAKSLHQLGYKLESLRSMKQRHIIALVRHWQQQNDSAGSIKNRMSHLRWLMAKFNKANVVPNNDQLGIAKRVYISNCDKSRNLSESDLNTIHDPLMRHSLKAQKLFGLRLEESLKIQPYVADAGDSLYIKSSWAKGGRERRIPILTEAQRMWLEEAKQLVQYKSHSLIPADTTYKTYRKRFEQACSRAGVTHRHGLRHLYAQNRYLEWTGWSSPLKGGLTRKNLSEAQKSIDRSARLQISAELGHSRIDIVGIYC